MICGGLCAAERAQQGTDIALGSFYLLVFEVNLMPLVTRIKVVCVDDMITGACLRLKHLIGLIIVGLEELFEVKVG